MLGSGVERRTAGGPAGGIPAVTLSVMLTLEAPVAGGLHLDATAGPTFRRSILALRDEAIAGWAPAPRGRTGISRLLRHGNQLAWQARRHLQLPLGNQ
jgi:hypothetical protein